MSPGAKRRILIVEDNEADVFLIEEAIKKTALPVAIQVAKDGDQALRYFEQTRDDTVPCPDLVLLDINLPKKPGGEVLRQMRRSGRCASARVIAVSTSQSARDREEMLELGALGYFRKPSDYAEFMKLGELVKNILESK